MKKFLFFCLAIIAGLFIILYFQHMSLSRNQHNPNPNVSEKQSQVLTADAINGAKVSDQTARTRPIAVMIENHPDARPQAGLLQADIIYETLAEGGITRFLAVYQSQTATKIGPVRSAREYFALLANEISAVYAHVGGSNEAISQIKAGKYKHFSDANEYYNGEFFPRPKDKIAPHNIYTSSELLEKLIAARSYLSLAKYDSWLFKDDEPATPGQITTNKINIDFSRPGYEVEYRYSTSTNSYLRFLSGDTHTDEQTGKQLAAKNVVIQLVNVTPVPNDPLLQVNIQLTGEGRAVIF